MRPEDLDAVAEIDRLSFPRPWSRRSYEHELFINNLARLWVAERADDVRQILGSIVAWYVLDEIHIATLSIHPESRRHGVAQVLVAAALREGIAGGATMAALEVRLSNEAAILLYRKFGFEITGRRKRYYRDNDEDALLMSVGGLKVGALDRLHKELEMR